MLAVIQPFDPAGLVLAAVLNPVVLAVAAALGWRADQWQKILVAGFAAAMAGALAVYLATALGIITVRGFGGVAGVFVASFVWGMLVAAIIFAIKRRRG